VLPTRTDLEAERLRRSLLAFFVAAWGLLDPQPFVTGFHFELMASVLEQVACGELRRLIINLPPRHGKSLLCSVAFPAWLWTRDPTVRILSASYAQQLATDHSAKARRLIESDWYQRRWGHRVRLLDDHNQKASYETSAGGGRVATAVGGGATGLGGELLIVDDPHKLEEAFSAPARRAVLDWFAGAFSTRLNNPRTGAIIIICQRVHERDLCGDLLASGDWQQLCLPAAYDPRHPYRSELDPRSAPGDPLWPAQVGPGELELQRRQLGSLRAAGQLQQLPAPAEGAILRRDWFRRYASDRKLPYLEEIVISCDLAYTGGPGSDYVVLQAWGQATPNYYLLDQVREQLSFSETVDQIERLGERLHERFPARRHHTVLIELAANGAAVIDVLRRKLPNVLAVRPKGSKEARAHAISATVEAGNVHLPGGTPDIVEPPWLDAFLYELTTFPAAAYDDQVDALTQALDHMSRPGPRLRVLG
jgi:predicted phage terminase large subunit-like protein